MHLVRWVLASCLARYGSYVTVGLGGSIAPWLAYALPTIPKGRAKAFHIQPQAKAFRIQPQGLGMGLWQPRHQIRRNWVY